MKKISISITLALFLGFQVAQVSAQSNADIIWQTYSPTNIAGSDELKTKLTAEIRKVVSAGHLAPFRVVYGEMDAQNRAHFSWVQPYDTVYTLSLAYPYLPSDLQSLVRTYLKAEMSSYPLWNDSLLPVNSGVFREPDELASSERFSYPSAYSSRPRLFALYALWLYAQNTGDWQYIETNWNSIKSFYSRNSAETGKHYSSLAGAIGMARMAEKKPTKDSAAVTSAVSAIESGFASGKNFAQYASNTTTIYLQATVGSFEWVKDMTFNGFQFVDITPEIARYFASDASLKQHVLGNNTATYAYSMAKGVNMHPTWYLPQAPHFNRYFGEASAISPEVKSMLFPLHQFVLREPASKLRLYAQAQDALVGDYYFIQNLTRVIQAHGAECWQDIRSTTANCATPSTPPPSPKPGDADDNNVVDGLDYVKWLNNYGKSNSLATADRHKVGDFNRSGVTDGVDYVVWLNNYGS